MGSVPILAAASALILVAAVASPARAGAQASITVTMAFSRHTLGPDTVVAAAVPGAGPGAPKRQDEVLITMRPGGDAPELARLAALTANGHPARGRCELVFRNGSGAVFRTERLAGCYVRRFERAGAMRRVSLGYSSISIS
jgi:hypothetical protein